VPPTITVVGFAGRMTIGAIAVGSFTVSATDNTGAQTDSNFHFHVFPTA
jgi:hypothetical protein